MALDSEVRIWNAAVARHSESDQPVPGQEVRRLVAAPAVYMCVCVIKVYALRFRNIRPAIRRWKQVTKDSANMRTATKAHHMNTLRSIWAEQTQPQPAT